MSQIPRKRTSLTPRTREHTFDILRAIAVLLVLAVHVSQNYSEIHFFTISAPMFDLGKHGVKLFFVLSGFLMMRSLTNVKPTARNYWRYMGKRFLRIYPAYIVSLFTLYLFSDRDLIQLITHIFLVQTVSARTFGGINYAYWSLSVEFIIYFLLPYFIWHKSDRNIRKLAVVVILVSASWQVIGGALRYRFAFDAAYNLSSIFYFVTALPAFVLGMYLKELKSNKILCSVINLMSLMAILDVAFSISDCFLDSSIFNVSRTLMHGSIGYICYGALFSRILYSGISRGADSNLGIKLLTNLGKISYSIYLWHLPILLFCVHHFGASLPVIFVAFALIFLTSLFSYYLIEKVWVTYSTNKLKFEYLEGQK